MRRPVPHLRPGSWALLDEWTPPVPRGPTWTLLTGWSVPTPGRPSWEPLAGWKRPAQRVSWDPVATWQPSLERLVAASARALRAALVVWDERLADLGGDPTHEDWASFRPLRLSREEDWSDWLAHVLHRAGSGRFAARLLGDGVEDAPRWRTTSYSREYVAEDYRADIILRFPGAEYVHVEVKVGDLHLEKTAGTGDAVQRREPGTRRADVLLLPEEDRRYWMSVLPAASMPASEIVVRTWHDVARALRACLPEAHHESITWRVWARAFLGAVEQSLLGFPSVADDPAASARPDSTSISLLSYLESLERP